MTIINTKKVLVDFKGENLKESDQKTDLTVGAVISRTLGGQVSNPTLGWILGKKFATQKNVELKAEEVVFIKNEIEADKTWFAIVKGQVLEILEGKVEEPAPAPAPKK